MRIHGLGAFDRHEGRALIPVLRDTGFLELAFGAALLLSFLVS